MVDRHWLELFTLSALCSAPGCQFDTRPVLGESDMPIQVADADESARPPDAPHDFSNPEPESMTGSGAQPPVAGDGSMPGMPGMPGMLGNAGRGGQDTTMLDASTDSADAQVIDHAADAADAADAETHHEVDADTQPPPSPTVPAGTWLAPCSTEDACNEGLFCSVSALPGLAVAGPGYCTTTCNAALATGCAQPADGTVVAQCTGALCLLQSCERAQCPSGMRCVHSQLPSLSGAMFSVYACSPMP